VKSPWPFSSYVELICSPDEADKTVMLLDKTMLLWRFITRGRAPLGSSAHAGETGIKSYNNFLCRKLSQSFIHSFQRISCLVDKRWIAIAGDKVSPSVLGVGGAVT